MNEQQWSYYVAFSHQYGFGAVEIQLAAPLTTFQQVQDIVKVIHRKDGLPGVVVVSWQLLREPSA